MHISASYQIKKIRVVTSCIKHWGLSGYFKRSAPHRLLQRQTVTKPEIPNVLYMYRCASAKKKTPTMEILPDKKELIMKGGTFQEQLSAFQ